MSLQDFVFPADIPWGLIATSRKDMLADRNTAFPNAMWKSSLAVFAYDPDLTDLPEVFTDRALTFLKVVCSVTSYTPASTPLPPPPDPKDFGGNQQAYKDALAAWKKAVAQIQQTEQTFPCSGAMVQVAISLRDADTDKTDISSLAYFASLEPQKRELIEVATESGESVTQSKTALNVRKGVTSTDSQEDRDLITGSANVGASYAGAQLDVGIKREFGTIKKSGTDTVNMTNTDTSREAREGSSHTTSISQLYHLLNSYHLGTNRAIFFLQPRPHTVQQKDRFTFINGPQEIEGIQEFFLVVNRPKTMPLEKYSVDALLHTAHLEPDTTSAALQEPKTLETPWVDLFVAAKKQDGVDVGALIASIFVPGIPGVTDPITLTGQFVNETEKDYQKILDQFNGTILKAPIVLDQIIRAPQLKGGIFIPPPPPHGQPTPVPPPPPIVFPDPTQSDWRVDRTRGLGGYDLWENPDNNTATPFGEKNSKERPQAFIDIVSAGDPNDPLHYRPDYALRVRAYIWQGKEADSLYHGRIKVYFIRNDMPTSNRKVKMFVTARGVSSYAKSPFVEFYEDSSLDPALDILTEADIHPPNIAPWQNPSLQPTWIWNMPLNNPAVSTGTTGTTASTDQHNQQLLPITSSRPSGLDPIAIGSARTKMANAISDQVRVALRTTIVNAPQSLMKFSETDLFFNRVAPALIAAEINKLASVGDGAKEVAHLVSTHAALPAIVGAQTALAMRVPDSEGQQATSPTAPLAASPSFPALTLGSPQLADADRQALQSIGIFSALDLINLPASELALRLGVPEAKARQIRLQAIGLESGR